jgi:secreted trypsin-like serine protease
MKKLTAILVLILSIVGAVYAQQTILNLPPGSKVYIEPMDGFENYLAAALQKKKVQLTLVANREAADFVITGTAQHEKAGWAKVAFQGSIHSDDQASISVVNRETSGVVFAYAVNKKNTLHGEQTTAEACAKHIQAHIEGRE